MLLMAVCCALGLSVIGAQVSQMVSQIFAFFGFAPQAPQVTAPETVAETVVFAVRLVVIPAFAEEMLFRGAILQSLRRFGDALCAVCIQHIVCAATWKCQSNSQRFFNGDGHGIFCAAHRLLAYIHLHAFFE